VFFFVISCGFRAKLETIDVLLYVFLCIINGILTTVYLHMHGANTTDIFDNFNFKHSEW